MGAHLVLYRYVKTNHETQKDSLPTTEDAFLPAKEGQANWVQKHGIATLADVRMPKVIIGKKAEPLPEGGDKLVF